VDASRGIEGMDREGGFLIAESRLVETAVSWVGVREKEGSR